MDPPPTLPEIQACLEAMMAEFEAHGLDSEEHVLITARGLLANLGRMRWEGLCCVQTPQKVISSKENADISRQTPPDP